MVLDFLQAFTREKHHAGHIFHFLFIIGLVLQPLEWEGLKNWRNVLLEEKYVLYKGASMQLQQLSPEGEP